MAKKNALSEREVDAVSECVAHAANMLVKIPNKEKSGELAVNAGAATEAMTNMDALSRALAIGVGTSTKSRAKRLAAELARLIREEDREIERLHGEIRRVVADFENSVKTDKKTVEAAKSIADWAAAHRPLSGREVVKRQDVACAIEVRAGWEAEGENGSGGEGGLMNKPAEGAKYVYEAVLILSIEDNPKLKLLHDRAPVAKSVVDALATLWKEIDERSACIDDLSARRIKAGEMLSDQYLQDLRDRVEVETKLRAFDEATSAGVLKSISDAGDIMFAELEKGLEQTQWAGSRAFR